MNSTQSLPDVISDETQLDELLTRPSEALIRQVRTLQGPLVILGAGGKMGPSLAVRVKRAAQEASVDLPVVAASRFSDPRAEKWLTDRGVETVSVDLLDRDDLSRLPEAVNIIYLVGCKFGTRDNPSHTWAINVLAPSHAMERYPQARLVALSTGNVYPLVPVGSGGSNETDTLMPLGEYPNAAIGRERIFEYYSRRNQTPVTLVRLNYATDLRYGVLTDIATKVASGEEVDVTNGYLNCIWQGDANDTIVRALELAASPPTVINLTGPETLSVREVAESVGRQLERPATITGQEADSALLSNASRCHRLLGPPTVSAERLVRWTAHWVGNEGRLLNKPTHFEVRDGIY